MTGGLVWVILAAEGQAVELEAGSSDRRDGMVLSRGSSVLLPGATPSALPWTSVVALYQGKLPRQSTYPRVP
jgi:hypothetical protein